MVVCVLPSLEVIFLSTLVACDPTLHNGLLFLMLSLSTFLNYFSKHQKTSAKGQGTFILVAGLRRTAGVAPPWKQDREAEQQQPTHLHWFQQSSSSLPYTVHTLVPTPYKVRTGAYVLHVLAPLSML